MTESEQNETTCPSCGYPAHAGHAPDCRANKGEKDEEFPIEQAKSEEEITRFYILRELANGNTDNEDIQRRVWKNMKYLDRDNSQIFLMKDKGEIIAGAQIDIEEEGGERKAYLGNKFVNADHRGKNLASALVRKRVDVARERGCKEVYSLVSNTNFEGLRSIMKDGFSIKSTKGVPQMENVKAMYYVYKNLEKNEPVKPENFDKLQVAENTEDLGKNNQVLIRINNPQLIEHALQNGYVGRQLVTNKEAKGINEPMLYLEKT